MKKKFIAGALALSMVLAGTGYAYWTDALNITTSASTGNMDLQFMDLGLLAQYQNEDQGWSIIDGIGDTGMTAASYFERGTNYNKIAADGTIDNYYAKADGYNDVSFDAKLVDPSELQVTIGDYKAKAGVKISDSIEVSLENIYPGYAQAFRTDVGNVGNVAAKLSKMDITADGEDAGNLKDMIGVAFLAMRECCEKGNGKVTGLAEYFDEDDIFTMGGVDFVRLSAFENQNKEEMKFLNDTLFVVNSKNRMDFDWAIAMDPDAEGVYTTGSTSVNNTENNDSDSMNKAITIRMNFGWDQFNEGVSDAKIPANILKNQNKIK
ncbi:MAG: signal peptide protein [Lachnospiraceae bacterium]|nr:signal peptide protein [Lachnospiraceae bacterium]